jgi:hypothetical protein
MTMTYSAYNDVLTGRTVPLSPAPITLEVWQAILPPDILDPAYPDSPLHCYHEARGYRFAWGHVLERLLPPDPEAPEGLLLWDVVLEDGQRQYHAAGGNLEALADMALVCLDTSMPQHAPAWLHDDDGDPPAAFAFLVETPHLPVTRRWLRTFLRRGLPQVLACVLHRNAKARRARPVGDTNPASSGRPACHRDVQQS